MKSVKIIAIFFFIGICFSCSDDDQSTQEQEAENLEQMFAEIETMAFSEACVDPAEWTFTSYGSKACGGPVGYIAYSTNIDTQLFLEKIEAHRAAQQAFNEKWGVISDCSVPAQPTGVTCENEAPVLVY